MAICQDTIQNAFEHFLRNNSHKADKRIKDYHRVELLWKHSITDIDQIAHLARLSKRVVQQYIDLLPVKLKNSLSNNDI